MDSLFFSSNYSICFYFLTHHFVYNISYLKKISWNNKNNVGFFSTCRKDGWEFREAKDRVNGQEATAAESRCCDAKGN